MDAYEERVRKLLEEMIEKVEATRKYKDWEELKFRLNDYLDEGYPLRDYIPKCNKLLQKVQNN